MRISALIILMLIALPVRAEWVAIDAFNGTVTHVAANRIGITRARKSENWTFRSGELERLGLDKKNTKPIATTATNYIIRTGTAGQLIYDSDGGWLYKIVQDTATALQSDTIVSINMFADDSLVGHRPAVSRWSELTLTDISSVTINDTTYDIYGFYSDTVLMLTTPPSTVARIDTLYGSQFAPSSFSGPPDAFVNLDTTWSVDGSRLRSFTGDTAVSIVYPTYSETGTVTEIRRNGDSLELYGDFDSSWSFQYLIMVGDNLRAQRGIPFECGELIDDGGGGEHLLVMADSARWAEFTSGADNGSAQFAIIHGGAMPRSPLMTLTGDFVWGGTYGATVNNRKGTAYGVFTPDDISWITSTRDWDCKIIRANVTGSWPYWYAKIDGSPGAYTIYMWTTNVEPPNLPFTSPSANADNVTVEFEQHAPLGASAGVSKPNEYTIVELHRQRAYYAGSVVNPNKYTWSYQSHFDSIFTLGEVLEGDDPIRALVSYGHQLWIGRRHSIVTVLGFSVDDFYKVPAPSGVGVGCKQCAIINPKNNHIYFVNEFGLWEWDGSGVTQVPTDCREIFSDSINWAAENSIRGTVWYEKYILATPFGTSTTNNRLIFIDLKTSAVTFITGINPASLFAWHESGFEERLYIGDADSSVIWELGANNDVYRMFDWRSGWYDGGDRTIRKRALRYEFAYNAGASGDTLIVDFYKDYSNTIVWSDTIVASAAGLATVRRAVEIGVQGHSIGLGVRSPDASATAITSVQGLKMDVVSLGREQFN